MDQLKHHGRRWPAEASQEPVELGGRTGALNVDKQEPIGTVVKIAVHLPHRPGLGRYPDERSIWLAVHAFQPGERAGGGFEVDGKRGASEDFGSDGEGGKGLCAAHQRRAGRYVLGKCMNCGMKSIHRDCHSAGQPREYRDSNHSACPRQPMPAEHFIPLRKAEMAERLLATPELSEAERSNLAALFDRLGTSLHTEFYHRLDSLKNLYAPFDPDRTSAELDPRIHAASRERLRQLFDEFDELAERANFRALTLKDLNDALSERSHWGLQLEIDIEAFERLEIYARGHVTGKRQRRRLRTGMRLEQVEVPIYERLIVMFRLVGQRKVLRHLDHNSVFIKLFKDIPRLDVDMLLPATSVKMTIIDRMKILLPTMSGLAIAVWKIFQGALLAAFAGIYGLLAVLGLVGGTIGYGIRSFYGYLNTKNKYQLSLTESLYYQNLDNNAGVFFRLLDEAEEQENCETLLGYFFLWHGAAAEGLTSGELDARVESFLQGLAGRSVDFEVSDALAKLERFGLLETSGDHHRVLEPEAALAKLPRVTGASPFATPRVVLN